MAGTASESTGENPAKTEAARTPGHTDAPAERPPFRRGEPAAYAIGDIGNGFYFQLVTNYAMIYMSDALGIAVGIIFIGKLLSAFTDLGTGIWSDNAPLRRDGRYRWSSAPCAIPSWPRSCSPSKRPQGGFGQFDCVNAIDIIINSNRF